jgi:multidrug efflux pump subunit AcrA (membrane-fusion protein)
MNRTLLLIIVDFLFLNLIALTRWDRAEPVRNAQPPVPEVAANAPSKGDDLVEAMRQSLADEQASRQDLAQKLAYANTTITAREQNLSTVEAQKNQLASNLTDTQRAAAELNQKYTEASQQAALSRDQLAQLLRELDEKNAEANRQREALAVLSRQQADSQKQIAGLTMAVVVGETEKRQLQDKADALQTQVQTERAERATVEQNSAQLAQGVGQLAQKSGELTKEIRDNRPINPNTLYNDFLANQVDTTFTAGRKGFFGRVNKSKTTPTVFVTDGAQVYALLHVADSVFSFGLDSDNWEQMGVSFDRSSGYHGTAGSLEFLASDPRVIAIPVDASQVAGMGVKVYGLATDPFKFPEAVLISGRGKGYGAVGFKLDPAHPGYVRVDNRFFKRLFGDFAPSRGDLVFSQSGELLGMMVNSDYCVLVKDFAASETFHTGVDTTAQQTGTALGSFYSRVMSMAPDLQ